MIAMRENLSVETAFSDDFGALVKAISLLTEVVSVGKSGGAALPAPGESDIDLFVFCGSVPSPERRRAMLEALDCAVSRIHIANGEIRHWGHVDFAHLDGQEICLMYFAITQMEAEIDSILAGERLDKEDNYFYPAGRCATLMEMHPLHDQSGFIGRMKDKLSAYPPELSEKLVRHHISALRDTEDLLRAVSRKDALFYHFALDLAIDHFLQALFALNTRFFPSRKRTLQHIASFSIVPADCEARLLRVLELGGRPKTVPHSYQIWSALCEELARLAGLS